MKWTAPGIVLLTIFSLAACNSNPTISATVTPMTSSSGKTWELAWSDEFDQKGMPDPDKWGYEVGYIRNNEQQYYTEARKENARVENGNLVLEARKEPYKGYEYTSASLITKGKAAWTYGRIEVRADIPTGIGMWPAIWMLGTNIDEVGWPDCGEIDIMENVGFAPDWIVGTVHTGAYNHMKGNSMGKSIEIKDVSADFHEYAIEWTPEQIEFFVDDQPYFTFTNDGTGDAGWPFDKDAYLILNIAIGGAWGGQQGIDETIFPQQMLVDYVRVYQEVK